MTIGAIRHEPGGGEPPPVCPHCQTHLPGDARFCPGCGSSLHHTPPTPGLALEKRQATVLHCDVVNSVRIGARLDLEDYHLLIHAVLESIREAVYRHRSHHHRRYDRTVGDAVLFCFGLPAAGEHDAELAAEAALAARAAVERVRTPPGITLALRIGIATGEVVAGMDPPPGGEPIEVTGPAPNLAARLQKCASPGGIAVSHSTRRLIDRQFECRDLGEVELDGIGASRVWELVGKRAMDVAFAGDRDSGAPFVGRESELETIRQAWATTTAGRAQVVLLAGEPGVGKSRLLSEFTARLPAGSAFVVTIRCSQAHRHTPFHPVIAHIERVFRLPPVGRSEERRAQVAEEFVRVHGQPPDALPLLQELVTPGTGIPPPSGPDDARTRRDCTIGVVLDLLFTRMRGETAAVVVIEDIHWADPSTLEVLRRAIDRGHPLGVLYLLSARPEAEPGGIEPLVTRRVEVEPLSPAQSAILVARMDRGRLLNPLAVEQIVARCDGVPLFIEQVMLTILDAVGDTPDTGSDETLGLAAFATIPLTLRDLLMSRLDRSRSGREVAQIGAVVGRVFSRDLLFAVSPLTAVENERGLADLRTAQLITEIVGPTGRTYAFRHALIQDVAYDSLLRSTRRDLHGRIARALSDGRLVVSEATPEVIARHFAEADQPEPALHYWRLAGRQATERSANVEAIRHFSRAIAMIERLPDDAAARATELELRALLVPPMIAAHGYAAPDVERNIARARELFPFSRDTAHKFVFPRAECQWAIVRAEYARAMDIANELTVLAGEDAATGLRLDAALLRGLVEMYRGDLAAARDSLAACCSQYDAARHNAHALRQGVDIASAAPAYLSRALWLLGETEAAERAAALAVEIATRSPITLAETQACCMKMLLHLIAGDIPNTRLWSDRTAALASRKGQVFWIRLVRIVSAWVNTIEDTTPVAAREIERAIQDYRATGARLGLSWFLLLRADAEQRSGHASLAIATVQEALAFVRESEERYYLPEIYRLQASLTWTLNHDAGSAGAAFEMALSTAERQGAIAWQARTTCSYAEMLVEAGHSARAADLLDEWVRRTSGARGPDFSKLRALLERTVHANRAAAPQFRG